MAAVPLPAEERQVVSRPTTTIEIMIDDRSELERLTRLVSIDDVRGGEVRATATAAQLERLDKEGWRWRSVGPKSAEKNLVMCDSAWVQNTDRQWNCYPYSNRFRWQ